MSDARYMLRALALARRGLGRVEPNPMVGCVIVRGGRIVAQGYHHHFGGPHAEVMALRDAAKRHVELPQGGFDVFVTLEPCCHHGKTPPCVDALIAARPRRVVAAMIDPFPLVSGKGVAELREAGITVEVGPCCIAARKLNEAFIKRVETGLPWVTIKWAQSLDGRIAAASGESKWLSNARSRQYVHKLRARVDAVMVGIGTVLADDSLLTARDVAVRRVARRVIVDPDLRIPEQAQLLRAPAGDEQETPGTLSPPVTIAVRQKVLDANSSRVRALRARGVELVGLPPWEGDASRLALRPLLAHLAQQHGASRVLVEGGGTLIGAVLAQGLADEALAFVTPKIIGDEKAPAAVRGLVCPQMDQARDLSVRAVQRFGDDMLIRYRVEVGQGL